MKNNRKEWRLEEVPTSWVNQASRAIMRHFEKTLRPLGFGMAYLPVAKALDEAGPLLQKDLAERCYVEQPTMAALLTRMERDGVIKRKPHPDDKRAALIALTAKGQRQITHLKPLLFQSADNATSGFSSEEKALLISLLQRMIKNLAPADE